MLGEKARKATHHPSPKQPRRLVNQSTNQGDKTCFVWTCGWRACLPFNGTNFAFLPAGQRASQSIPHECWLAYYSHLLYVSASGWQIGSMASSTIQRFPPCCSGRLRSIPVIFFSACFCQNLLLVGLLTTWINFFYSERNNMDQ